MSQALDFTVVNVPSIVTGRVYAIQLSIGPSPISIHWNDAGSITALSFDPIREHAPSTPLPTGLHALVYQLEKYFSYGEPLGPIPWEMIDQEKLSDFQKKVFKHLEKVPYGETRTYSWLAWQIGQPLASRAVGQALRRNPFPVLVPCHRIVSTVSLGGFMGALAPGTPEVVLKQTLLSLEYEYRNPTLFSAVWA